MTETEPARPDDRGDLPESTPESEPASAPTDEVTPAQLVPPAIARVRSWLADSPTLTANRPADRSAELLAGVLTESGGLEFTTDFVDRVIRPDDVAVAAGGMRALGRSVPGFLPTHLKAAVRLGAVTAPALPRVVVPAARAALRRMVRHLVLDARPRRLGPSLAALRADGSTLNINLLGEAVLGRDEAARRLENTRNLLARHDIDYVSLKVSAAVAPHSPWAFDESVAEIVAALLPIFRFAAAETADGRPKFINLDMEEYKDLRLTMAVFTTLLADPDLAGLPAGIALQAYLPDALAAMMRLQEFAAARVSGGGAPIKVRLVKGANLPMERIEAELRGWPLAVWPTKAETDASYKAVLWYALTPRRLDAVHLGIAGHNLFDIAWAIELAAARGVPLGSELGVRPDAIAPVEFEMLVGMAPAHARSIGNDVGPLRLYTPVVHPEHFDSAIAYLIRRLDEGASTENFLSAAPTLTADSAMFERESNRFAQSIALLGVPPFGSSDGIPNQVPAPRRDQNRGEQVPLQLHDDAASAGSVAFANAPDTDPVLPANQSWGRAILSRSVRSSRGQEGVRSSTIATAEELEAALAAAHAAGKRWRTIAPAERAATLRYLAQAIEASRGALLEVMASEAGKTLEQGDPEVSEAIDFANYYADSADALTRVSSVDFVPRTLTLVAPPWNFPVAIPAGSVLAALASGTAVILKPAPQAARCGAVLHTALRAGLVNAAAAGLDVDTSIVTLICLPESEERSAGDSTSPGSDALGNDAPGAVALGPKLIGDPRVDQVILTGAYETAETFRMIRPNLRLFAETSGKNAIIVTPSADYDLAARDIVASAFGHSGQKCSAASLAILVGSAASSTRLREQILDATRSLTVGPATRADTQAGPLIAPPGAKLLRGLTELGPGESWALEPEPGDGAASLADARVVSPGIRIGVQPGSDFHRTEFFGPVLGVMTAGSLTEAIDLANAVDYGLTAGLHSLDPGEWAEWIDRIEAGNLYVNRSITGAIVRRQPFGGWKKSAVGAGAKAGGPNYLAALGNWADHPGTIHDESWLAAARADDQVWWDNEFGASHDPSGLAAERNVLRYRPVPVAVRYSGGGAGPEDLDLRRVLAAAARAGAAVTVSSRGPINPQTAANLGAVIQIEPLGDFVGRVLNGRVERIRVIGPEATTADNADKDNAEVGHTVRELLGHRPDISVYDGAVTGSGRVELLPFLREQSISMTAHRFGNPFPAALRYNL